MTRLIAVAIISAISSIGVSSAMNSFAVNQYSNSPRCSTIKAGGQYWLEYKDGVGRTQSTKPARIVGGAKVCILNPATQD